MDCVVSVGRGCQVSLVLDLDLVNGLHRGQLGRMSGLARVRSLRVVMDMLP